MSTRTACSDCRRDDDTHEHFCSNHPKNIVRGACNTCKRADSTHEYTCANRPQNR